MALLAAVLVLVLLLFPVTTTTALSSLFRRVVPPLEQELGCSPTLSRILKRPNYYFDPFQLATDQNFARYRECELKHGRVCMLATIGMLAPHVYRELLADRLTMFTRVLSSSTISSQTAIPKTALQTLESLSVRDGLRILATCAFLEAFVFVQREPTDMPGDYGTGYFGLSDKGENERSLESELENGRLAMVAFVVQIVSELVTGKNIIDQWASLL